MGTAGTLDPVDAMGDMGGIRARGCRDWHPAVQQLAGRLWAWPPSEGADFWLGLGCRAGGAQLCGASGSVGAAARLPCELPLMQLGRQAKLEWQLLQLLVGMLWLSVLPLQQILPLDPEAPRFAPAGASGQAGKVRGGAAGYPQWCSSDRAVWGGLSPGKCSRGRVDHAPAPPPSPACIADPFVGDASRQASPGAGVGGEADRAVAGLR